MGIPAAAGLLLLGALCVAAPLPAGAQTTTAVHPLGTADPGTVHEMVQGLLSAEGRAALDEGRNTLVVLDTPEVQGRVRELLARLQQNLSNIRVESRIVDRETGREAEVGATGQLMLTFPETSAGGTVFFNVDSSTSRRSGSAAQFVVVASGSEAAISIGKAIPYERWFLAYAQQQGLVSGETGWREVGSRLAVRPTAIAGGSKVRLEVVPELDYLLDRGGRGRKGGERRGSIVVAGAATELVVDSGQEVRVGGSEESEEFYERFLVGYDRQRRVRTVDIFIRATVLPAP